MLKNNLTERVYVGDLYCFCVTEFVDELDGDGFFLSMCSRQEYDSEPNPIYNFVGIKRKADGWNLEKIEEALDDKEFVFEAAMMCMSQAMEHAKITKASQEEKQERLIEEVKAEIRNASEMSAQTCWTLEEASKYSKIGINRLRQESLKKSCTWVLWVGETKRLVKIDAFKEWLADIVEVF